MPSTGCGRRHNVVNAIKTTPRITGDGTGEAPIFFFYCFVSLFSPLTERLSREWNMYEKETASLSTYWSEIVWL